jgi:uncharacterized membrane protein
MNRIHARDDLRLAPPILRAALLISLVLCAASGAVAQDQADEAQRSQDTPVRTQTQTGSAPTAVSTPPSNVRAPASDAANGSSDTNTRRDGSPPAIDDDEQVDDPTPRWLRNTVVGAGILVVLALTGAFLWLTRTFIEATRFEPVGIDSNWGGFGGGLTGWSLSRSLSLLVVLLLLASFIYLSLEAVMRTTGSGNGGGGDSGVTGPRQDPRTTTQTTTTQTGNDSQQPSGNDD